jgi:hypothetical protein
MIIALHVFHTLKVYMYRSFSSEISTAKRLFGYEFLNKLMRKSGLTPLRLITRQKTCQPCCKMDVKPNQLQPPNFFTRFPQLETLHVKFTLHC